MLFAVFGVYSVQLTPCSLILSLICRSSRQRSEGSDGARHYLTAGRQAYSAINSLHTHTVACTHSHTYTQKLKHSSALLIMASVQPNKTRVHQSVHTRKWAAKIRLTSFWQRLLKLLLCRGLSYSRYWIGSVLCVMEWIGLSALQWILLSLYTETSLPPAWEDSSCLRTARKRSNAVA